MGDVSSLCHFSSSTLPELLVRVGIHDVVLAGYCSNPTTPSVP